MSAPFARHALILGLLAAHSLTAVAEEAATGAGATEPAADTAPAATPEQGAPADAPMLEGTVVHGTAIKYSAEKASSPKYTEPLRDTPQTITIVNEEVMQEQGLLSLRDVLSTVPGITFGAGEGGGGFGDSINIRGYSASGDIAIDGVRDTAQYSRSDTFNLESIEVVKGSSSVYSGSGAIGGTVNLVSKSPKDDDFTNLSMAIGSDNYQRATVDTNRRLDDGVALRVNVMTHANDVPGRDYEYNKRWGIAPAITFGIGEPTSVTLAYAHQEDENTPQYGVPFYNGRALPGVDPGNYYGYHNFDIQENKVDFLTGIFEHEFNDNVKLRNLARYSHVKQFLLVDPPQAPTGGWCLPDGAGGSHAPSGWSQTADNAGTTITTNTTGYVACGRAWAATPGATTAPNYVYAAGPLLQAGQYQPSGPRGNVRDTENTVLVNQSDLTWKFTTGSIAHTAVTGLSISYETWTLDNYREFRAANGWELNPSTQGYPVMDVFNPNSFYSGPVNRTLIAKNKARQETTAVYAFDTLQFNDRWLLNAGLRYERVETHRLNYGVNVYTAPTSTAPNPVQPANVGTLTGTNTAVNTGDDLLSWRTGVIYKPAENGSVYLVYGNSMTPSVSTVNGTCVATTTNGSACTVDPEEGETIELGTKWDVLNRKMSLTSAVFRNDRTNYRVNDPGNPANPTAAQQLDGKARVEGIELGAAGLIRPNWSVFANYTWQRSEVLRGASAFVAAGGASGTEQDWTKGDPLMQVPDQAASLWTTWDVTRKFQLGYGLTYQGQVYLTQHSGIARAGTTPVAYTGRTTIPLVQSADYVVHNMSATWKVDRNLDLQLNVKNLLDEVYYTRMRNNGWATPGDARSATVTMNYSF